MAIKRKQFTAAEKAKVALVALKGDKTINEISSDYGVHPSQIHKWKQVLKERVPEIFSAKQAQRDKSQDDLVESLYNQIGKLTVERDWLKKKSDQFS